MARQRRDLLADGKQGSDARSPIRAQISVGGPGARTRGGVASVRFGVPRVQVWKVQGWPGGWGAVILRGKDVGIWGRGCSRESELVHLRVPDKEVGGTNIKINGELPRHSACPKLAFVVDHWRPFPLSTHVYLHIALV